MEPKQKPSRPKITLSIPTPPNAAQWNPAAKQQGQRFPPTPAWAPPGFAAKGPLTPVTNQSSPYFNPFVNMYHSKASEFMFKQFAGVKDFTMNTAKSGLSFGEKSAFWMFNKLRLLSKRWFTHISLFLLLAAYSVIGALIFVALEGPHESTYLAELTELRRGTAHNISRAVTDVRFKYRNELEQVGVVEQLLRRYEDSFTTHQKMMVTALKPKTWSFWNAMFYSGTIFTTIGMPH